MTGRNGGSTGADEDVIDVSGAAEAQFVAEVRGGNGPAGSRKQSDDETGFENRTEQFRQ